MKLFLAFVLGWLGALLADGFWMRMAVRCWVLLAPVGAWAQVQSTCSGDCTVTHVITLNNPVLNLDLQAGGQISGAILLVWVVGYGFRILIQALRQTDKGGRDDIES